MNFGFGSDNHSGIHPDVLNALIEINAGHSPSYGTDDYTHDVIKKLKTHLGVSADIHFVFNGTAANVLCLMSLIESHHAVICAETAHLNLDECGAPENSIGCKLLTIPSADGKIRFNDVERFLIRKGDQHYAQPKLLSITLPTEYGTCYSLAELKELRDLTREHGLYMHIDGSRIIHAAHYLKCELIDLTENLGIDALSLGGTKNGLLFGEACILYNPKAKEDFKFKRKQLLQLPSKMRFIASQFDQLINNNLWRSISKHEHDLALYMESRLKEIPEVQVTQKAQANSVFAKLPKAWIKTLKNKHFFYVWDEFTKEVRLMFSFDNKKEHIDSFIESMKQLQDS